MLLLASLTQADRSALLDDLLAALSSLEARLNPLLLDLAGASLDEVLAGRRAWLLPAANACLSLADGRWGSPPGPSVVALPPGAPACGPGERELSPVAQPGEHPEPWQLRARFVAWPLGCGVMIRFPTEASAAGALEALRARVSSAASLVAAVVDRDALSRRLDAGAGEQGDGASGDLRELRARARAFVRLRAVHPAGEADDGELTTLLGGLAEAPSTAPLLPFLALSPGEVLVVPRQGALARVGELRSEVSEAVAGRGVITPP
jgi:hypothetical protein